MESHKLRIKVGEHEFEAEGSPQEVTEQFQAWKELITSLPPSTNGAQRSDSAGQKPAVILPKGVTEVRTRDGFAAPWDIFEGDDKRKLVTLKIHPTGEDRDADALLLILFGFKKAHGLDEVPVTKLIEAIQVSGIRPGRIDRALAKPLEAGLVLKAGRAKGSKYRLTNTGYSHAEELARTLFAKAYVQE